MIEVEREEKTSFCFVISALCADLYVDRFEDKNIVKEGEERAFCKEGLPGAARERGGGIWSAREQKKKGQGGEEDERCCR